MPNRYLRESYRESEAISRLSWQAETLWTRLLVTVDDWGRCEASVKLLRPKLYPLRLDQVKEDHVEKWVNECEDAGLLTVYIASNGKQYLQMHKWEVGRAEKSKFPEPPQGVLDICYLPKAGADTCKQLQTSVRSRKQPQASENKSPDSDSDTDNDSDTVSDSDSAAKPQASATNEMQAVVDAWNAQDRLPKVMSLSDARKRSLKARLSDPFFRDNYRAGIARMAASAFCRGEKGGGWKATFDFLLQADTLTRVMEGKYDDRGASVSIDKGTYALTAEETTGSTWNPLTDD